MPTSAETHDEDVVGSEGLASQGMSRRAALTRIGVGGAVLWASPMLSNVALAGPTSCHPVTLDWDTLAVGASFPPAGITLQGCTVTLSAASFGNGATAQAGNRTVVAGPQGGISQRFFRLNQSAVNTGFQTVTFNFSYPVYTVSFTITDIDNLNNGWSDRVSLTPTPTTVAPAVTNGNTRVTGAGTVANPLLNNNNNLNLDPSDNRGNVTLRWAGPLTSISIRFACANVAGSNQLINISDINFCV